MRAGTGRRRVALAVDSPEPPEPAPTPSGQPLMAALLGGVGVAIAGFLLALAAAALAWLRAPDAAFSPLSHAATSVWLLAHGASAGIGGVRLGIMPLGFTGLVALLAAGAAGHAAAQRRRELQARHDGLVPSPGRESLRTAGLVTGAYLVALLVLGSAWASSAQAIGALPGAFVVVGLSALAGAMGRLGWRPWRTWPVWARALPAATASALLTLLAGSGLVGAIALAEHWRRISALQTALHAGAGGGFVLLLLQLIYLPNLLLWAGSWMLGAGFSIGGGTAVTPVSTQLGFLPAVPVFGAVPSTGAHSQVHLLWLGVGVLAGALASLTVSLSRRRARFDEVALVGGLAGVVCALLFVLLAWLSGGALGANRLAQVGPRLGALVVLASTVLGLSGLVTGAIIGVLRPPHDAGNDTHPEPADASRRGVVDPDVDPAVDMDDDAGDAEATGVIGADPDTPVEARVEEMSVEKVEVTVEEFEVGQADAAADEPTREVFHASGADSEASTTRDDLLASESEEPTRNVGRRRRRPGATLPQTDDPRADDRQTDDPQSR